MKLHNNLPPIPFHYSIHSPKWRTVDQLNPEDLDGHNWFITCREGEQGINYCQCVALPCTPYPHEFELSWSDQFNNDAVTNGSFLPPTHYLHIE